MRIGIFGGSFNPVHTGHLIIAEYVREQCSLDKILFVPVGIPSHRKDDLLSYEKRVELLELAIKNNSAFEISNIEKGISSYTYETYLKLKEKYPNDKLFEIIGEDSFAYLEEWKYYDKMMSEINFIVFRRGELKFSSNASQINLLNNPQIDISSTMIRENINAGTSIKYLLPEEVENYILRNNFYKEKK